MSWGVMVFGLYIMNSNGHNNQVLPRIQLAFKYGAIIIISAY